MHKRRRFTQSMPLKERLALWATETRKPAANPLPGPKRDELIKKTSQADMASHLNDWANSSGLRAPT
jgi:hypothetical protein